jgi:hypothetical protein
MNAPVALRAHVVEYIRDITSEMQILAESCRAHELSAALTVALHSAVLELEEIGVDCAPERFKGKGRKRGG